MHTDTTTHNSSPHFHQAIHDKLRHMMTTCHALPIERRARGRRPKGEPLYNIYIVFGDSLLFWAIYWPIYHISRYIKKSLYIVQAHP